MEFKALTKYDVERIRQERNQDISGFRTSYLLTEEMQEDFYYNDVCNRNSKNRWWGIWEGGFVGQIGLTDISLENRNAEISIFVLYDYRRGGIGERAVEMLLDKAFNELNLDSVFAECFEYNPAVEFWDRFGVEKVKLPMRKYWSGKYWASYFYIFRR